MGPADLRDVLDILYCGRSALVGCSCWYREAINNWGDVCCTLPARHQE